MARGKNKKPRSERRAKQREAQAREAYEVQILEDIRCPRITALRALAVCDGSLELFVEALTFLNTAAHAWDDDPERAELRAAIGKLRDEIPRHLEVIVRVASELTPMAEADEDHEDLTREELMHRLEPMFAAQEAREADGDAEPET